MSHQCSFINGSFSKINQKKLEVANKYSNQIIGELSYCDDEDLELAISSSVTAFESYKKTSAQFKYDCLQNLQELIISKKEELAQLICEEAGKPIAYALGEVDRSICTIEFAIEESRRIHGDVIAMDFLNALGRSSFTKKVPLGPVLAISPFNFPLNLALHKIAPALACGCSVVLKPSLFTPLVSLKLAELIHEAGFPKGIVNVVICENDLSEKLVKDERFKLLSFTGSPKVGWFLKSIAGKKKVTLELGGNAAVIVDESRDLAVVAKKVAMGINLYAGQICISTQRVLVNEIIYDDFKNLLIKEIRNLPIGDPNSASTIIGPLISSEHVKRVKKLLESALQSGSKNLLEDDFDKNEDNIIRPALFENIETQNELWCEEAFAPVGVIKAYSSFEEAIGLVNDSKYGLQVGIFTDSLKKIKNSVEFIDVAGIIINDIPGFRIDHMPYGGIKDSGLGREGIVYAIEDMTYEKLVVF